LVFLIISFAASAALTGILALIGSRSVVVTIEEREKIAREAIERQMEIEKLMDALKKSSEARTTFLSGISSSMADPINHIIRLSSLLSKYTEITEDHQKHLEVINDQGMKLFTVINDILDILNIEAGKLKFKPVKYHLPKLISDITSLYLVYIKDKPIEYKLIIDDKLPENLIGDELRIKQICHHIINNAFKYTPKGNITVDITCKRKDDYVWLIIKIIDTGMGMTADKLNTIFANYGQGTGKLGLFLCKRLAEIMKGTLTVTSEYGNGSVFTLCVPQKLSSHETIAPDTIEKLTAFKFNT
jgi:signal transduction histidine kinase